MPRKARRSPGVLVFLLFLLRCRVLNAIPESAAVHRFRHVRGVRSGSDDRTDPTADDRTDARADPLVDHRRPSPAGQDPRRLDDAHAALFRRVVECCRRRAAAKRAASNSSVCASWVSVSGSSLAGHSRVSPSSIVEGRSGSALPRSRRGSGSANQLARRGGASTFNDLSP